MHQFKSSDLQVPQRACEAQGSPAASSSSPGLRVELDGTSLVNALDHIAYGVVIYDDRQRLRYANAAYRTIYRLSDPAALHNNRASDIHTRQGEMLGDDPAAVAAYIEACERDFNLPFSGIRKLPDGRTLLISRQVMNDGYSVSTHEDITERLGAEERILFAAHHDPLTKLPNRLHFMEQMNMALAPTRREDRVALLMFDLDMFKEINDTHGHAAGDALLVAVGERLRTTVRETDQIARLGGDEFAVLQTLVRDAANAEALAKRLSNKLSRPYMIDGNTVLIGASIGIAMSDGNGQTAVDLLQQADFAMYRAKEDGRGGHRFFEAELDKQFRARRDLEANLRRAIVLDEFQLHYQPIINLRSDTVDTIEALIRWPTADGWISPGAFIPIAEETGLILAIGDWAMRRACEDALALSDSMRVAVNVSPLQFKLGNLVQTVDRALAESGLPANRLQIEITESLLLDRNTQVLAVLKDLNARGVAIVLDDFGTGYSSLSYLTRFPFDKLKIDRAFIADLPAARDSHAILRAISALGRDLNICMTLEGVETVEQLAIADAEDCCEVQGFYFAKPTARENLPRVIAAAEALARQRNKHGMALGPPPEPVTALLA